MGGGSTVWLVGMMGAGKSSVGPALAVRLGLPFLDTDAEIERQARASVAEIFAREGEEGFRARERKAVADLAGRPAVVALGGGAVCQPAVRDSIQGSGPVVYLRARAETLSRRLGEARDRPLLQGLDDRQRLERIRQLLARREAAYARAGITVDTDERNLEQVLERVLEGLEAVRA